MPEFAPSAPPAWDSRRSDSVAAGEVPRERVRCPAVHLHHPGLDDPQMAGRTQREEILWVMVDPIPTRLDVVQMFRRAAAARSLATAVRTHEDETLADLGDIVRLQTPAHLLLGVPFHEARAVVTSGGPASEMHGERALDVDRTMGATACAARAHYRIEGAEALYTGGIL